MKQNQESTEEIQSEQSGKDMASSGKLVVTIGAYASPQQVRNRVSGRVSIACWLACHTHCKCSMETTRDSINVKIETKRRRSDSVL